MNFEEIKNEIKSITAEEMAGAGFLTASKKSGYNCPACGNGTGENGTGLTVDTKAGFTAYRCYKCGKSFDNIAILAAAYHLDCRADFTEIIKRACSDFGLDYTPAKKSPKVETAENGAGDSVENGAETLEKITDEEKAAFIAEDLALPDNLEKLMINGKYRAIYLNYWRYFGCVYVPNWRYFGARKKGLNFGSPRLLVPAGNSYLARLTAPLESFDEESRKYLENKEKVHAGTKNPFGLKTISADTEILAVVEGYIDAISIWQVLDLNCRKDIAVVALGSATYSNRVFKELVAHLKGVPFKKPLKILGLLDNDEAGKMHSQRLREDFITSGYSAAIDFLPEKAGGGKLDANDILVNGDDGGIETSGECLLYNYLTEMIKRNAENWKAADSEIEKLHDADRAYSKLFVENNDTTDLQNAYRIFELHKNEFRYNLSDDYYYLYDAAKYIWQAGENSTAAVIPLAIDTSKTLAKLAKTRKDKNIARQFEKGKNISAAFYIMRGIREIVITSKDLDKHNNLLVAENGVVDLETLKVYTAAAEVSKLYLTQAANARYVPNWQESPCEIVDNFLEAIQPNEESRQFLIDWLGYCLTGEVNIEKFVIMQGGGGNGKGTLTGTISTIFGTYAASFPIEGVLLRGKNFDADSATPTLAMLEKIRLALSEEIPPNAKVDPSRLKLLTGGDRFFARQLHQNGKFINPTAKFVFSGNNAMQFPDANDYGISRRLIFLPFMADFRQRPDIDLKKKLLTQEARDYLFSMMINAANEYYRRNCNLVIPESLKAESENYLAAQDFISEFIAEYCIPRPDSFIKRQEFVEKLREIYPRETPGNNKDLTEMLKKALNNFEGVEYCGYENGKRTKHGVILKGIAKSENWQSKND